MNLQDVLNIEEGAETDLEYFRSLQRAINSGSAWSMQGSMGRSMMAAIEDGRCLLGPLPARDYWGNYIPSRKQVKTGTKGSKAFVAKYRGKDWASQMSKVK
jgi:hypothetical protein